MKYALIESHRNEYKTKLMCELLSVPRSSFYAWSKRPVSQRDRRRALVGQAVEAAYLQFKKRYGAPRLAEEPNDSGIECSSIMLLNY